MKEFDDRQSFQQDGLGKMEEMNLTGGLGGFQQMAGRAPVFFKWSFFGVEKVGKREGEKKKNEEGDIQDLPFSHVHPPQKIAKLKENVNFGASAIPRGPGS
ncbi:MAG: hypothetical protein JXE07_09765, partial [Candidatus Aminicenantes bacterium]|nr:hypothetical protein [Candidatus Aminicenantes bacterium]